MVLDTCALIEICKDSPKISAKTLKKMMDGFYVLSISFAEIACKIKFGTLEMRVTPKELYNEFCQIKDVTMVNIGVDEWLDAIELDWKHKDPADRMITAFGMKKRLPIVTSDQKIKTYYKNVIW
jgi:PIN domain nuclease of toxin-antitoxin system